MGEKSLLCFSLTEGNLLNLSVMSLQIKITDKNGTFA